MSEVLSELLTGTVGFILAMIIIAAAVGVFMYSYFTYAQHQVIKNYLWAVADAVPLPNGQWFLGIVNTGTEQFFVKQVLLANGQSITVNSKPLLHNQWWNATYPARPSMVIICYVENPSICEPVKVSGYATWTPPLMNNDTNNNNTAIANVTTMAIAPGVYIVVNDPYGIQYWLVKWQIGLNTYGCQIGSPTWCSRTGSGNAGWVAELGNLSKIISDAYVMTPKNVTAQYPSGIIGSALSVNFTACTIYPSNYEINPQPINGPTAYILQYYVSCVDRPVVKIVSNIPIVIGTLNSERSLSLYFNPIMSNYYGCSLGSQNPVPYGGYVEGYYAQTSSCSIMGEVDFPAWKYLLNWGSGSNVVVTPPVGQPITFAIASPVPLSVGQGLTINSGSYATLQLVANYTNGEPINQWGSMWVQNTSFPYVYVFQLTITSPDAFWDANGTNPSIIITYPIGGNTTVVTVQYNDVNPDGGVVWPWMGWTNATTKAGWRCTAVGACNLEMPKFTYDGPANSAYISQGFINDWPIGSVQTLEAQQWKDSFGDLTGGIISVQLSGTGSLQKLPILNKYAWFFASKSVSWNINPYSVSVQSYYAVLACYNYQYQPTSVSIDYFTNPSPNTAGLGPVSMQYLLPPIPSNCPIYFLSIFTQLNTYWSGGGGGGSTTRPSTTYTEATVCYTTLVGYKELTPVYTTPQNNVVSVGSNTVYLGSGQLYEVIVKYPIYKEVCDNGQTTTYLGQPITEVIQLNSQGQTVSEQSQEGVGISITWGQNGQSG